MDGSQRMYDGSMVLDAIGAHKLPRAANEKYLDLILQALYDCAGYDLSIDYRRQPAPPFEGEDAVWVEELHAGWQLETSKA